MSPPSTPDSPGRLIAWALAGALTIVVLLGGCAGAVGGVKAFDRYQSRADRNQNRAQRLYDERNNVQVNSIRIAQTNQLVKVAQQEAAIRYANAVGVRRAQDEISSTLTPLYVQFEMIDALKSVAASGKNNSVVFIPSGANGVPLVSTLDPTRIGKP